MLFDPDESDELSLGPLDSDDLELPPNLPDFTKGQLACVAHFARTHSDNQFLDES